MARQIVKLQFMLNYQQVCSRVSRKQQRRRLTFVCFLQSIIPMEKFFHQLSRDILTGRHTRDRKSVSTALRQTVDTTTTSANWELNFFTRKKLLKISRRNRAHKKLISLHIETFRSFVVLLQRQVIVWQLWHSMICHLISFWLWFSSRLNLFSLLERNSETFGDSVRQSILSNTIQFPSKTIDKVFSFSLLCAKLPIVSS